MQANELTALADRVEALEGPTAEIFGEAFDAIFPRTEIGFDEWLDRVDSFTTLLDAEAWTSAAEMLVPEGWSSAILNDIERPARVALRTFIGDYRHVAGTAATPALALLAASLRARAGRV